MCGDILPFSSENYLIFVRNVLLKPIPSTAQGNIVIIKYIKGYLSSLTMLLLPREICAAVKCFISHQNQSCASHQDSSDTLFPCPRLFVNRNCSFPLHHLHGRVVAGRGLNINFTAWSCVSNHLKIQHIWWVFFAIHQAERPHTVQAAAPLRFPAFLCVL